ncbi:hypothetical protein BGW38_006077, partial [Lunasporangiospora selenospora]
FRYDRPGLLNLLTVSRFFFQEALRLIICGFLAPVNTSMKCGSDVPIACPRLFALFVRSLLLHQCLKGREREEQHQQQVFQAEPGMKEGEWEGIEEPEEGLIRLMTISELSDMLKEFGLMRSVNCSTPLLDGHCGEYKKTVVDYSIYLTRIESWHMKIFSPQDTLELYSYIDPETDRRIRPLVLGEENGSDGNDLTGISHGASSKSMYNEIASYTSSTETRMLTHRILRLFLHHNHHYIVHLGFYLHEAPLFAPFATKLSQLQSLHLDKRYQEILVEQNLPRVISLIQQNQNEFPSKPCLDFTHDHLIDVKRHGDYSKNRAYQPEPRKLYQTSCESLIQIYETIGKPRVMDVGSIPHFYEKADKIHVKDLQYFTDKDNDRLVTGEGPAMEDFLKRCYGLKSLELVAGDPSMFRWAIPSPNAQQIPGFLPAQSVQRYLERLEKLTLQSNHRQHALLHVLNDAVATFGKTLREIVCRVSSNDRSGFLFSLKNAPMLSEQGGLPKAKPVGEDWNLPSVRRIYIELNGTAEFGSFDGCPLLEELTIILRSRKDVSVPSKDPIITEENIELMPVWKLPRLRILSLSGESMVRFNFESLRSMKRLTDLTINARFHGADILFSDIYLQLYPLSLRQAYNTTVSFCFLFETI